MKKKKANLNTKVSSILLLLILLGLSQLSNTVKAENKDISISNNTIQISSLSSEDLNWTAVSLTRGNEYSLLDIKDGVQFNYSMFNYSITNSLITIQENRTFDVYAGLYAIVPVTNDHLAFSCEMRVTAEHPDARNGIIKLYDPVSMRRMDVTPIVYYRKDSTYDSGFNYIGVNYTIPDYDEVIMYIYYEDAWATDLKQSIYIKDFKIHQDDDFSLSAMPKSTQSMDEYDWDAISTDKWDFHSLPAPNLTDIGDTDFIYEVNETYLHLQEIDSGTFDSFCGVYTTIPVVNHATSFSFEGKTKSNSVDVTPNLKVAIYDTNTKEIIKGITDIGCWNEYLTETEFNYFEFSLLVPEYTEVDVYFYYSDSSDLNDQHEFWIRNFVTYNATLRDSPIIKTSNEVSIVEGSSGNFISWTIFDKSTGTYALYRNSTLIQVDDWISGEPVSLSIDDLSEGNYFYSLEATNEFGHKTDRIVFVTVAEGIDSTTSSLLYTLLLGSCMLIPVILKRKRKY